MTYKEIAEMVESMGFPFAYYQFPEKAAPSLPYVIFYYPNNDDLKADNSNYQTIVSLNIELYTANKDFTNEATVESVLNAYGLVFEKSETYLSSEKMYEVLYQTSAVITAE